MAIVDGDRAAFTAFFADEEPRLHRAFTLLPGPYRGWDATAEAMAWAWANWAQVQAMENPVGHLYRSAAGRPDAACNKPSPSG